MESTSQSSSTTLELEQGHLAVLLDSLQTALFGNIARVVGPPHPIHELPFNEVRAAISLQATTLARILLAYRVAEEDLDQKEAAYGLSDAGWDLIDSIEAADGWSDLPSHRHSSSLCMLCRELDY